MKDIFRKAWDCFLRYPLLGVPIFVAAVLGRSLHLSLRSLSHSLIHWSTQTHSVLGPTVTSGSTPAWLPVLIAVVKFALIYTEAIVATFGILITACFAYRRFAIAHDDVSQKILWSRSSGGILIVSLLSLLLSTLIAVVVFLISTSLMNRHYHLGLLLRNLGYVQTFLGGIAVAYLIVPFTLRVIAKALGKGEVHMESAQKAQNAAILIAVLSTAASFGVAELLLRVPLYATTAATFAASAIEAFPQVLLAIVFGLLLADSNSTSVPTPVEFVLPTP